MKISKAMSFFRQRFFTGAGALTLAAFIAFSPAAAGVDAMPRDASPTLVLVAGAPGEAEFGSNFVRQAELWTAAASRARVRTVTVGISSTHGISDLDRLKETLTAEGSNGPEPLWLVFIGHGTFDGKEARFNLRGPDVTAAQLSDWLKPMRRPLVFIDAASASAPFLNKLSATNRVIITATRSGNEQNFARFGQFFAAALDDPQSDLDKDGQVSVLEAFLVASARVAEFYKTEGRLATEHALLDDNGDGLGTPADWFRGIRAVKQPAGTASVDGTRAHQFHLIPSREEEHLPPDLRARRDAIELSIARLRERRNVLGEADYLRQLESLLMELIAIYGKHL